MSDHHELEAKIDQMMPALVQELEKLVAIPSISSSPEHTETMTASAEHVKTLFESLGFSCRVSHSICPDGREGKPALLATKKVLEDAPTVLLYAHHDVQPTGNIDKWSSDPFTAITRGDRLYGRGSADDGAGIIVHYGALGMLAEDLPVNVSVFIEGEEEIGSPSFTNFLADHKEELAADVIIVADSNNWTVDIPAITSTLRGVCACDVTVEVLSHAVHSGMYGGPILDAVTLSAMLIASLYDDHGDVKVPGLGGDDHAEVEWDEADFRRDASVIEGYHLAGTGDLAARVWTKPALAVIGIDARPIAEASNTIASECTFRLSLRTVPGGDPQESLQALTSYLEDNAPFGAKVTVTVRELGPSFQADLDSDVVHKLRQCLAQAWGEAPVNIGVGGSIPFISDFQDFFPEAEVLVTGVEDPRSNAHSEDESMSLKVLRNATLAEALLLRRLGER